MSTVIEKSSQPVRELTAYIFVAVILGVCAQVLSPPSLLLDLSEFYGAATMLVAGRGAEVYIPEILRHVEAVLFGAQGGAVLYLPPTALPLLFPLGLVPLAVIRQLWWALIVGASVLSLANLRMAFALSLRWFLRLAALVAVFGPQWESIKHGQVAPLLLLAYSAGILSLKGNSDGKAALAFAVLGAKPQFLLPVVAFLLGARRIRMVALTVLCVAVLALVGFVLIGARGVENYVNLSLFSMENRQWMVPEAGPTLRGQLLRFFPGADIPVLAVSGAVLLITLSALAVLGHRVRKSAQFGDAMAITVLPAGIVTALHCQSYDVVLLVPTLAALVGSRTFLFAPIWARVILASALALFVMPVYNKVHYDFVLRGVLVNPFFVFLAAAAATLVWLVWREGAASPSGTGS